MNYTMLLSQLFGGGEEGGSGGTISFIIMIVILALAAYFLMYRPQKKKEKQAAEKRNSLEIGDEVTTIGGIVGRVVSLKEDTFVIETAGDRSRMRFKRWAIQEVNKLSLEGEGEVKPVKADKPAESTAGADGEDKKKPFWRR